MATARKQEPESGPEETPAERFQRLAPKRTEHVLAALRVLGNCAGPGYEYTPEQAEKIIGAVRQRLTAVEAKFLKPKVNKENPDGFNL